MARLSLFSLFFIFCQIQWIFSQNSEKKPSKIVETTYGKLQGFEFLLENGKSTEIFLGIPFAQPPTEKNRFEKPRVLSKFDDLKQVTEWKPGCTRFAHVYQDEHQTSEDCLYLNIFAPKEPSPNEDGYPVLFWIHGGGYRDGSASAHGYQALANHFVSRGLIVVVTQYRLGPIGFAAWGDDNFPGNYGLWDLWAALRYVKRNIKNFGGDASRITLWGESAGGAAVSALTLSKHTRDLFSQAIQNSGSQFSEWANSNRVIQSSETLAKKVKCETDDSQKMKDCLKAKPIDEITDAFYKLHQDHRRDMNPITYQPRLDADFFTNDLPNLVEEAPKKPTMIGVAELESLWFTSKPVHGIDLKNINDYSREDFIKFVRTFVSELTFPKKSKEVEKRIVEFYLDKNAPDVKDGIFYFQKFTELHSDLLFNIPIMNEVRIKAENGWKMFTYLTRYINKNAFPKEYPNRIRKSLHAYEYPYIFNITSIPLGKPFAFTENDKEFVRILIDTMVNFVKNGNPSTDDIDWQPAIKDNKFRYLELKPFGPEMKVPLWPEKIQFWTLLNKHYEFDIIRGIHKKTLRSRDEL